MYCQLYIDVIVAGRHVKALVGTGCSKTIGHFASWLSVVDVDESRIHCINLCVECIVARHSMEEVVMNLGMAVIEMYM